MLHEPNKTNNHSWSFSLFQNLHMLKKKKIRYVSKKDTNQFLVWEKFKSASKEDADPFILKNLGLFSPPGINPDTCWHFPLYLTCFEPLWSKDSLVLVLIVMRDRSNNDSDYRKLAFVQSRPHKSYTRTVYICASRSSPSNVLNLIFKARLAPFRDRFSLDN